MRGQASGSKLMTGEIRVDELDMAALSASGTPTETMGITEAHE